MQEFTLMATGEREEIAVPVMKTRLALLLFLLVVACGIWVWQSGEWHHFSNKDRMIVSLRQDGIRGPLICVGVQIVQVVIFVIPGEITQLAAGYVFGAWWGFLYSAIGIMLGSAFNFYFARAIGRPALQRIISSATLEKVDKLLDQKKGKSTVFILFILPGVPKDALCYGAGFSNMSFMEFMVISGLGRSPFLLATTLIGSQVSRRDYYDMLVTGIVVLLAIAGYYFYERERTKHNKNI
jgi:uncharacterized membrane protein YdjX (TVP38/TMEM64 family)